VAIRHLSPRRLVYLVAAILAAYNQAASLLSVLTSEGDGGVFEIGRSWLEGDVPPRLYLAVVSSLACTALIAWAAVARWRSRAGRPRDAGDTLLVIAAAAVVANCAMCYPYTKHEILSVAGAFYALAAYVGARQAIELAATPDRAFLRAAVTAVLAVTAVMWAFRSAGVHHMVRVTAFRARIDWVGAVQPGVIRDSWPAKAQRVAADLAARLRHDALEMRVTNPYRLPRWPDRWWGE